MTVMSVPDAITFETLAALREENERLTGQLRMAEALAIQAIGGNLDGPVLPEPVLAAFTKSGPGDRCLIYIDQSAVTLVMGEPAAMDARAVSDAWAALIDVYDSAGGDAAGMSVARMIRTDLPKRVAAMAWHSDGQPVVVCGPDTSRADVRAALHAGVSAS